MWTSHENEDILQHWNSTYITGVLICFHRNYALKRIRDAFKENKTLSQAEQVQKQYQFAHENLGIIKRQVSLFLWYWKTETLKKTTNSFIRLVSYDQTIIGRLYSSDQLVIEKQSAKK